MRELTAAGVAAIHIEDQVTPKKCSHMEGKHVVPAVEMAGKVSAAVAARGTPDFLVIARTDARAVDRLRAALDRGRMYREAGADMLFIEAPQSGLQAGDLPDQPLVSTAAIRSALSQIKADGTPINLLPSLVALDEFLDFVGTPGIRELDRRFADVTNPEFPRGEPR